MVLLDYVTTLLAIWTLEVDSTYYEGSITTFNASAEGTYFGYSIAFEKNTNSLIIGAPKDSIKGHIYSCSISNAVCSKLYDSMNLNQNHTTIWLGATVATGSDFIVACAPRFVQRVTDKDKIGTFGRCYSLKVPSSLKSMTKLNQLNESMKETGLMPYEKYFDSLGWSLNVDSADNILVGGPAMYLGRAIIYSGIKKNPTLISAETLGIEYNFGYSVTSGRFKSANKIMYAISSPYGNKGKGKIILVDEFKKSILKPPSDFEPPVGSTLGASMCSAKLRGAGQREALLIGAPTYAQKNQVNVGIVYVYILNLETQMIKHEQTILGTVNYGQFGSAVISLGDLDNDGKDEIAISAPYEDGRGAVYIYSAKEILSRKQPSDLKWLQRLSPAGFSTIGLSLAVLRGNDESACNDLAIGAPGSDTVILYRCIPQIKVTVSLLKEVVTPSRKNDTFFMFTSCVKVDYPTKPTTIKADITVQVTLIDAMATLDKSNSDGFIEYKISTLTNRKSEYCTPVNIIITQQSGYQPLVQYHVTATQKNSPLDSKTFDPAHALVSRLSELSVADTVWVANCMGYKTCIPDLNFDIVTSMSDGYIIGSSDNETLYISVRNTGDVAYSSCFKLNVIGVGVRSWSSAYCKRSQGDIVCTPSQPIKTNSTWISETIELETKSLKSDISEITFDITMRPDCRKESTSGDRQKSKTVKLAVDTDGVFVYSSTNYDYDLLLTQTEIEQTGKQTKHTYTVNNRAVTTWANLRCDITVNKTSFFKNIVVTINTRANNHHCKEILNVENQFAHSCIVSELKKGHNFQVLISINVEPGAIDFQALEKNDLTLSSTLILTFNGNQIQQSITSKLKLKDAVVPIWVIIAAALVGIFLMLIIIFALKECGFLKRKNKEELNKLRRDVHRQSVRRSMAASARESARAEGRTMSADREELLEEVSLVEDTPIPQEELPKIQPLPDCVNVDTPYQAEPNNEQKKKELIILGLQKNIGAPQLPPLKPPHRPRPPTRPHQNPSNK